MIRHPEDEAFLEEMEQLREWFADKLSESAPLHPEDIAKMHKRMIAMGWMKNHELERYEELMKEDD